MPLDSGKASHEFYGEIRKTFDEGDPVFGEGIDHLPLTWCVRKSVDALDMKIGKGRHHLDFKIRKTGYRLDPAENLGEVGFSSSQELIRSEFLEGWTRHKEAGEREKEISALHDTSTNQDSSYAASNQKKCGERRK